MSGMPAYPQPSAQVPVHPGAFLKSPVGLSKALVILFGAVIAADLFAVAAGIGQLGVVGRLIDNPEAVSTADADRADALAAAAAVLQTLFRIATIVVFLCWFWRVRVNAEVFAPDGHGKARGWTIGGWFCPVVNWWFPRRIALDIWHASTSGPARATGLVNGWWGLFTAYWVVGWLASRQFAVAETPEKIQLALGSMLFADVLSALAAIAAVLFVRRLTAMQTEKALQGPPAPPFVPNLPAL
ncbi:DUF4328 domain-containing protein [Streptomyces mesophilus]|uniref:DUF4328 domain-containing protein n=1 Tax=Streptomyces mesophilus TaxID=1775132 RepID=UPI0033309D4A